MKTRSGQHQTKPPLAAGACRAELGQRTVAVSLVRLAESQLRSILSPDPATKTSLTKRGSPKGKSVPSSEKVDVRSPLLITRSRHISQDSESIVSSRSTTSKETMDSVDVKMVEKGEASVNLRRSPRKAAAIQVHTDNVQSSLHCLPNKSDSPRARERRHRTRSGDASLSENEQGMATLEAHPVSVEETVLEVVSDTSGVKSTRSSARRHPAVLSLDKSPKGKSPTKKSINSPGSKTRGRAGKKLDLSVLDEPVQQDVIAALDAMVTRGTPSAVDHGEKAGKRRSLRATRSSVSSACDHVENSQAEPSAFDTESKESRRDNSDVNSDSVTVGFNQHQQPLVKGSSLLTSVASESAGERTVPPARQNLSMPCSPPLGPVETSTSCTLEVVTSEAELTSAERDVSRGASVDADIHEFRVLATSSTTSVVGDAAKTRNPRISADVTLEAARHTQDTRTRDSVAADCEMALGVTDELDQTDTTYDYDREPSEERALVVCLPKEVEDMFDSDTSRKPANQTNEGYDQIGGHDIKERSQDTSPTKSRNSKEDSEILLEEKSTARNRNDERDVQEVSQEKLPTRCRNDGEHIREGSQEKSPTRLGHDGDDTREVSGDTSPTKPRNDGEVIEDSSIRSRDDKEDMQVVSVEKSPTKRKNDEDIAEVHVKKARMIDGVADEKAVIGKTDKQCHSDSSLDGSKSKHRSKKKRHHKKHKKKKHKHKSEHHEKKRHGCRSSTSVKDSGEPGEIVDSSDEPGELSDASGEPGEIRGSRHVNSAHHTDKTAQSPIKSSVKSLTGEKGNSPPAAGTTDHSKHSTKSEAHKDDSRDKYRKRPESSNKRSDSSVRSYHGHSLLYYPKSNRHRDDDDRRHGRYSRYRSSDSGRDSDRHRGSSRDRYSSPPSKSASKKTERHRSSSNDKYSHSPNKSPRNKPDDSSLEDLQQSTTLGALIARRKKLQEKLLTASSDEAVDAAGVPSIGDAKSGEAAALACIQGVGEVAVPTVSLLSDSAGSDMEISDLDESDVEIIMEVASGNPLNQQAETNNDVDVNNVSDEDEDEEDAGDESDDEDVEVIAEVNASVKTCAVDGLVLSTSALVTDDGELLCSSPADGHQQPLPTESDLASGDLQSSSNHLPLDPGSTHSKSSHVARPGKRARKKSTSASQRGSAGEQNPADETAEVSTSGQSREKKKKSDGGNASQPTDVPAGMDPFQWKTLRCRQTNLTRWGHEYYREYQNGGMKRYLPTRIVSYNLLSQDLMDHHPHLYAQSKPCHTDWSYRANNLINELYELDADIYCLQEVHNEHYRDTYLPAFEEWGYVGVYKQRLHDKKDGCAIFFNKSKFILDKSVPVEFFRPGISTLDRDNIALIVSLIPLKKTGQPCKHGRLIVSTTHLLFNPKRGDIKLAQTMLLLAEIDKVAALPNSVGTGSRTYHPVVITGDFNTQPNAPLYRLLLMGFLNYKNMPRAAVSGQLSWGGFGPSLNNEIIPRRLGISDSCQYISELVEQVRKLVEQVQRQGAEPSRPDRNDDPPENDGRSEVPMECDGEKPGQSGGKQLTGLWQTLNLCRDPDWKPGNSWSASSSRSSSASPVPEQSSSKPAEPVPRSHTPSPVNAASYQQCSGTLTHQLPLNTVHKHFVHERGDLVPEVTSHHLADMSSVDYIFYTVNSCRAMKRGRTLVMTEVVEGRLKLVGSLALPTPSLLKKGAGPLPNSAVSSDHVALAADFVLDLK